jgi:hypothetical protein
LPSGFQKVRHYGFHSAVHQSSFEHVRWLVTLAMGLVFVLASSASPARKTASATARCPDCGAPLKFVAFVPFYRAPAYFDSS